MGYTTEFWGEVAVSPPLNESEVAYLNRFSDTRRMDRHSGPYTVEDPLPSQKGSHESPFDAKVGQRHTADVINYNDPPTGQPGLWCQWEVDLDGGWIRWNGAEKFYNAAEWMKYLIEHFLQEGAVASTWVGAPEYGDTFEGFTFDHILNGTIEAQGEDPSDRWRLVVKNNRVQVQTATFVFEEADEDIYDDMSLSDLMALADERGITGHRFWTKWLEDHYDPARASLVDLVDYFRSDS